MEVHDIVQEAVIKTIPMKKKYKSQNGCLRRPYKQLRKEEKQKAKEKKKGKEAKWLSEEDLQIAEKRREAKGKKERYIHLNAEFQRIARREIIKRKNNKSKK